MPAFFWIFYFYSIRLFMSSERKESILFFASDAPNVCLFAIFNVISLIIKWIYMVQISVPDYTLLFIKHKCTFFGDRWKTRNSEISIVSLLRTYSRAVVPRSEFCSTTGE